MSAEHEPPPPSELADLLAGMRADTLTKGEVAQLAQRLGPLHDAGGGGGGAPPPRPMPKATLAAAGGGVAAIAITIWLAASSPPEPSDASRARAPAAAVGAERTPEEIAPPAAVDEPDAPHEDVIAIAPTTAAVDPPERAARPRAAEPPANEHTLLADARRALETDPARALALAEQHRRAFRDGALAPEREMIAIDALSALGREPAARRRAAALAERWPRSGYAERVRARGLVE